MAAIIGRHRTSATHRLTLWEKQVLEGSPELHHAGDAFGVRLRDGPGPAMAGVELHDLAFAVHQADAFALLLEALQQQENHPLARRALHASRL